MSLWEVYFLIPSWLFSKYTFVFNIRIDIETIYQLVPLYKAWFIYFLNLGFWQKVWSTSHLIGLLFIDFISINSHFSCNLNSLFPPGHVFGGLVFFFKLNLVCYSRDGRLHHPTESGPVYVGEVSIVFISSLHILSSELISIFFCNLFFIGYSLISKHKGYHRKVKLNFWSHFCFCFCFLGQN